MSNNKIEINSVSFASLELTSNLLLALNRRGIISAEECNEIFNTSIAQQRGVGTEVNHGAANILSEMQSSFRSVFSGNRQI